MHGYKQCAWFIKKITSADSTHCSLESLTHGSKIKIGNVNYTDTFLQMWVCFSTVSASMQNNRYRQWDEFSPHLHHRVLEKSAIAMTLLCIFSQVTKEIICPTNPRTHIFHPGMHMHNAYLMLYSRIFKRTDLYFSKGLHFSNSVSTVSKLMALQSFTTWITYGQYQSFTLCQFK